MSGRFLLQRLLQLLPAVAGIVLVGFLLVHLAPGDPVIALAGESGDSAYYAFMRQRFGLDRPLFEQLGIYAQRVAVGDLGASYVYGRSAMSVILERVPATLLLTGTALLIAIIGALPLGILAARRPHTAGDLGISSTALAMYSTPVFLIGQLAILLFALHGGLFPVQGMFDAGTSTQGAAHLWDLARHLMLPAFVLAAHELAVLVRVTRGALAHEMTVEHVRTARGKGVSEFGVLMRHTLPRALLPVITVVGGRAGQLVTGAVVVEVVFGWPGIGRLLLAALQSRDIPVLLGIFMLVSVSVVVVNLITDLVYAARDPRVELA